MYAQIYQKFLECIEGPCELNNNYEGKIIAAVSGGADSLCLLLLLKEYVGADRLICAHFNHMIRGEEAERDEHFTEKTAAQLGIKYVCGSGDVPAYVKENAVGTEEAARHMRYAFLQQTAEKYHGLIAVAHNRNDNAETILYNIARGTAVDGLKGISYKKNNVIRPVLNLNRSETEEICRYFNILPVYDSTNADNLYKRNKIRNEVLPYLCAVFDVDFDEKLLSLSKAAAADSSYLNLEVCRAYDACCIAVESPFERIEMDIQGYQGLHEAIQKRLIRRIMGEIKNVRAETVYPDCTGIYSDMIERIYQAAAHLKPGRIIQLTLGAVCLTGYGKMYFTHESCMQEQNRNYMNFEKERFATQEVPISGTSWRSMLVKDGFLETAYDADKLEREFGPAYKIEIRLWREGDHFTPFGAPGGKTLRKYFIDRKILQWDRARILVAAIGKEIIWVPGMRRSAAAPIDKNTSRVIMLKYISQSEVHG